MTCELLLLIIILVDSFKANVGQSLVITYKVCKNNADSFYYMRWSSWEICLSMRQISLRERVEIA